MMNKLFASLTVAGVLCGYAAMLYALVHIVVGLNQSYLLSLAM
jgi:hypothetical protein